MDAVSPTGVNPTEIVEAEYSMREIGRVERWLGPEFYKMFRGIITNPLSVTGIVLIVFFILIAILAP